VTSVISTVFTVTITVVGVELTVDELAERSGASVRTIRYYQSEGLLPAPERHGREVRYGAEHVARLDAIADLQGRGLRLQAIGELLRGAGTEAADDWLGLGARLARPWSDDEPVLLDEDELTRRVGDVPVDDLVRVGLVEPTRGRYLVASPGLLDVALQLLGLGIDLDTSAGLRTLLEARLSALAGELVSEFTARFSLPHLAEAGPAALSELLDALQPVTGRTVDLIFAHEMERAQRALLDAALHAVQEEP
jgi:DNA-binding transcriptional MerR regulator